MQALCDRVSPGAHRYGQSFATLAPLVITSRATRCLRGQTRSLTDLSSDDWSEEAFADELAAAGNALALELHASLKAEALYFAGDLRGAERWLARAAEHVSPQTRSSLNAVSRVLFTGLVAARRCEHTVGRERKEQLATLRRAARKIARFRRRNDEDFAAHDLLLKAELSRLSGELGRGRELYDAAIEAARGRGSQKLEAIGLELAARASLGQGRELVGELYLRASRRAYVRWGAQAKAEALVREFPAYLTSSAEAPSTVSLSPASSTTLSESIDVSAIVKASRAISSELILESLLRRLITIVVENAGAQRGVVLLDQGGELRVEAEHDVEAKTMRVLESAPIADQVCAAMVLLVVRTHRDIVLDDARRDPSFARDPYITRSGARSVLCTALLYQGALRGVLYLENRATVGVFTVRRLGLVKQLAGQIAISIENARLYQDLARARDRAVAADKAKSQFLLTMSHELRTPLNAVIGYTEIVGEDLDDDDVDAAREDLGKISVGARRLVRTLTSILELTRLESGGVTPQRARVALAPLLDDVVAECEELHADNHNELHTAVADGVPEATESDLVMLRYILFSVLDNGCRFTTDGRVTLRVAAREVDGQPWLRFLVEDTGIGFPAEAAERIFEPFRQADDSVTRTHEGAGVSLAVVRRFCAALGGAIDCRSEVGEGSTFIIDLPAGRPAPG
ncbi:MAG: GAF domain-containing sensor histidine kinase [Myxococcales bacterium]|nr:GAF domain-containing sensor histidine kinase [Myxococcales bacterium]